MADEPHIMIVESRFYDDIADLLLTGAVQALEAVGASYERFDVSGALELPAAIKMGAQSGKFDGFIALGCVIRGKTYHFEVVSNESARGIMDLGVHHGLAVANGVLTCENKEQAIVRADPAQKNKGGSFAQAALSLINLNHNLNR